MHDWKPQIAAAVMLASIAATSARAEERDPADLDVRAALTLALQDEYHARDTYRAVLTKLGDVRPFVNVVAAEERHIAALVKQFDRLGYPIPEPEKRAPVSDPATRREACEIAVAAERANIALYDRLLKAVAGEPSVENTFRHLQEASRERHLPAFERCAKGGGRAAP